MNKIKCMFQYILIFLGILYLIVGSTYASDQCMFEVTADDMPPNVVLLLDNGVEMAHPVYHDGYDSGVDYTPDFGIEAQVDVVLNEGTGNGFFNEYGYGIYQTGGSYYLVPAGVDLVLQTKNSKLQETGGKASRTWTINDRTIILPAEAASTKDSEGIIDGAGLFRYSKNYLNWLFFYTQADDLDRDGEPEPVYDPSSPLPDKSRFYYAKKALLDVGKLSSNKAKFSIYNFTSTTEGASSVQPIGNVVTTLGATAEENVLDANYVNNINNMGTVLYSPLAEGLASIGTYIDSNSFGALNATNYCQKTFVIVVSSGMSSEDKTGANQSIPGTLEDFDADGTDGQGENGPGQGTLTVDDTSHNIATAINGSTYLDDVAHYFFTHDMRVSNDAIGGWQNVITYTVGFMASPESRLFLINTSNNGNGNTNLTQSSHPDYGKYHFEAKSADGLSQAILNAVNDIIKRTSTFVAPVVPVTRTTSGDKIYMAFFKPSDDIFWEGFVVKFGLNSQNEIVDATPQQNPATWANGAIKADAIPFWTTKDWADTNKSNGIHNSARKIYTYLGSTTDLTDEANQFAAGTPNLNDFVMGNPSAGADALINFIRGADVLDEDADDDVAENRQLITGDVLHSEPLVVTYHYADKSARTMVFFGANDGMLHAVLDQYDPDITNPDDEVQQYGMEAWAFIPPDQLDRLKYLLEGINHVDFIDASPKAYFHDENGDGIVNADDGDRIILVCGARKGGSSYFALDITVFDEPKYLWRILDANGSATVRDVIVPELGQSWSEPQFGKVKTSDDDTIGTPVFFIGGGYSTDNSAGKAVLAINVFTGAVVRKFTSIDAKTIDLEHTKDTAMSYSIASSIKVIDEDDDGFTDKLYVGDLGGQVWRFGQVSADAGNNPLVFPDCDENINRWEGLVLFRAPTYVIDSTTHTRKFYNPPSVTFERGFDLVFIGSGDRESACSTAMDADRIYAFKDKHGSYTLTETDLVDVTVNGTPTPNLSQADGDVDSNGYYDQGWYIRLTDAAGLPVGEKALAKSMVYNKVLYITTFTPNNAPCLPGGAASLYAVEYLTGASAIFIGSDIDGDGVADPARNIMIGGGIPSKPVIVLQRSNQKILLSVGSTTPETTSQSLDAGIIGVDPLVPNQNFYRLWWRQLFM